MEDILNSLNDEQKNVILNNDNNVLILAGAGTGKTRVITSKIIYFIKEKKISPGNILAVTFTNKAANEMKARVQNYLKYDFDLMIKTFHSFCAYILRNEAFLVNRSRYFQISDSDDSIRILKKIINENKNIDNKNANYYYKLIQIYKQNLGKAVFKNIDFDNFKKIHDLYEEYLLKSNCFDFEDLISKTIEIFNKYPIILEKYKSRFKYILVDEYQDTNKSQFELLKQLKGDKNKILVVGDEDQSIYKFRGADINNILNFQNDFDDAKIIKLELNYRSTKNILETANSVIANNQLRLGKNLYSNKKTGSRIIVFNAANEFNEVEKIIEIINQKSFNLNETAILYRTNNQSRPFEQIFNKLKIPFVIVGSIAFYEREEIKDAISILKWIINPMDRISFSRFINKPPKGIGEKTLSLIFKESEKYDYDILKVLKNINKIENLSRKICKKLSDIYQIFYQANDLNIKTLDKLFEYYLEKLKIYEHYEIIDSKEGLDKVSNLKELASSVKNIDCSEEEILNYLENVTLSPVKDEDKGKKEKIKLLTAHNAKGLEFENVFIVGMEEGLFPSSKSMEDDFEEHYDEEERRLFYVAITRAKNNLVISYCLNRNLYGVFAERSRSRFIDEMPENLLQLNFYNQNVNNKMNLKNGDIIKHKEFGKGKIIKIDIINGKRVALVDFWDHSCFELFLDKVKLEKIDD
ncbi:MAG: ATP-dependent helicase [Spirochaetes bacterium]|nr:ATP-dependent helicase [Spirochaetota bacterium]